MNKGQSVAIIGAGWIGQALAKSLQAKGANVLVTTTSTDKLVSLSDKNMPACLVNAPLQLAAELLSYRQWVICIPPGVRQGRKDYPVQIQALVDFASQPNSKVEQLILLSSTAVYNGLPGTVNEHSKLDSKNDKVALLSAGEQALLNSDIHRKTVLRLGGLFGYSRQPGRFFVNKPVPNPESVINFIHQDDVIGILQQLLNLDTAPEIVNGVCPHHPTRRAFYQSALQALQGKPPQFAQQQETNGKHVESVYLADIYPLFKVPNLQTYFADKFVEEQHDKL